MVRLLREHGKTAFKVIMEEVTPASLMAYRVDAFVCTACPRIAMDDSARYDRPMLTIPEAEIVLGERTWDGYAFDQIRSDRGLRRRLVPGGIPVLTCFYI